MTAKKTQRKLQGLSLIKQPNGFTIIEVLIVLTVASLILLLVFMAVPSLQRNSRNTQYKADASNIISLMSQFAANRSGALPDCLSLSGNTVTAGNSSTGCGGTLTNSVTTTVSSLTTTVGIAQLPSGPCITGCIPPAGNVQIFTAAVCGSGNQYPSSDLSNRQYVAWFGIEGARGATIGQCLAP